MKRPMTPNGYHRLQNELQDLKGQRPEIARMIEVARGHGDLSENADYDAAKEKSGMNEAKIRDIETKLANAEVIDPRKISTLDRIVFGLTAVVEEVESGEQHRYTIVGEDESDVSRGFLSLASPIGKALIGKEVDDTVEVRLPSGKKEFEVIEILVEYEPEN